ncbi:uncharacterized protein LTR77_002676 [Saxophila tyrrhenica]|uniref:Uncharacterized protein n=1 Tax=Saxophila tyrrhenica TaxID=1690608 RepID=A0AAV9PFX2_9PEZI|nr:hypothetical protein LTR77_002676 [Saxophila tyrrhenica]
MTDHHDIIMRDGDSSHSRQLSEPAGVIEHIEARTHRLVTIETGWNPSNSTFANCHPQEQSRLFQLPQELRDEIFQYVALPYDNPAYGQPCDNPANGQRFEDTFCCREHSLPLARSFIDGKFFNEKGVKVTERPCYESFSRCKYRYSIALLATSRRAWLEANQLFMGGATHSFWIHEDNGNHGHHPDGVKRQEAIISRFAHSLTPNHRKRFNRMQVYIDLEYASSWCGKLEFAEPYIYHFACPKVLVVTLRSEVRNFAGKLDYRWAPKMLQSPGWSRLRQLRVELELVNAVDASHLQHFACCVREAFLQFMRDDHDIRFQLIEDDLDGLEWPAGEHAADSTTCPKTIHRAATIILTQRQVRHGGRSADASAQKLPLAGRIDDEKRWWFGEGAWCERGGTHAECEWDCQLHRDIYREKWEKEGSLLKFAPLT